MATIATMSTGNGQVRVLAEGLPFGEGPRWHIGRLWFSDFHDHAVKTVDLDGAPSSTKLERRRPAERARVDAGRRAARRVDDASAALLRLESERLVVHADLNGVATWHCNDMVVDAQGRRRTSATSASTSTATSPSAAWPAVLRTIRAHRWRWSRPDGTVSVAATELDFPNGTVDHAGRTDDDRGRDVRPAADGVRHRRRRHAERSAGVRPSSAAAHPTASASTPRVRCGSPNPLAPECVRVAEGGEVLQVVATDQACFACMLGGDDGRSLFMLTAGVASAVRRQARTRARPRHRGGRAARRAALRRCSATGVRTPHQNRS